MGAPLSLFSDEVGDVRPRRRVLPTSLGHLCCHKAPPTSAVTHIIGELQERCQAIKGSQQASALQGYPVPSAAAAAAAAATWARVRLWLMFINQHECRRPDTAQREKKKKKIRCGFKCRPPNYKPSCCPAAKNTTSALSVRLGRAKGRYFLLSLAVK